MDRIRTCGKCGDTYESYMILFKNSARAMLDKVDIEDEYGNVCKSCRAELADNSQYGTTEMPDI